jgi:hypothetical protein
MASRAIRCFFWICAERLADMVIKGDDANYVVLVSISRCGFKWPRMEDKSSKTTPQLSVFILC